MNNTQAALLIAGIAAAAIALSTASEKPLIRDHKTGEIVNMEEDVERENDVASQARSDAKDAAAVRVNDANIQSTSRNLINKSGYNCEAVTSMDPLAAISDGSVVLRANCSNGDQYAMKLLGSSEVDYRIRLISSCAVFTASTNTPC